MGQSISVIATDAARADDLLASLQLTRTDQPDADCRQPFSGGALGDQFIIWRNWRAARPHGPFADADLIRASVGQGLLVLDLSETTMFASLRRFENGRVVWSADACDGDDKPLALTGPVPNVLTQATAEVRAHPEDSDFEVPVRTFEILTGLRHDAVDAVPFTVLQSTKPEKRPIWKLWG